MEEEGRTVLSGKVLAQMAKTLRDAPVSIETTDNGATLKCGRSRFKLMTLDPLDFPSFPAIDAQQSLTIGSDVAAELVKRVEGAASKDEHRPVLNGVHLTCDEENVTLVATDSYRLAVAAAPLPEGEAAAGLSATIPTDAIRNVILAASKADTVTFGIGEGLVSIEYGDTSLATRTIEGTFPDHHMLIPKEPGTVIKLDPDDLASAVKRVTIVSPSNGFVRLNLNAEAAELGLAVKSISDGEANDAVQVEVEGQSVSMALNYHYLLHALNCVSGDEETTMSITDPMRPAIFRSRGSVNYLCLLMPVRD